MTQPRSFVSKNLVALIMVPAIIGGHYGWYRLQQVEELVGPKDRQLPLTAAFGKIFDFGSRSTAVPAEATKTK